MNVVNNGIVEKDKENEWARKREEPFFECQTRRRRRRSYENFSIAIRTTKRHAHKKMMTFELFCLCSWRLMDVWVALLVVCIADYSFVCHAFCTSKNFFSNPQKPNDHKMHTSHRTHESQTKQHEIEMKLEKNKQTKRTKTPKLSNF